MKIEPVVGLLFAGMMVMLAAIFAAEKFLPSDGQLFQVVSNLLAGFSGAFFMRIKTSHPSPSVDNSTNTIISEPADIK